MTRSFLTQPQSREAGAAHRGLVLASAAVVIAGVLGVTYLRSRDQGAGFLGGLEPLPEATGEERFVETAKGQKVWPRSAPLVEGVQYSFNTGHCGLEWMTDFDGSFWTPTLPEGAHMPDFFISEDEGVLTVMSHDRAHYRSSTGESALLIRHEGPLVVEGGCA